LANRKPENELLKARPERTENCGGKVHFATRIYYYTSRERKDRSKRKKPEIIKRANEEKRDNKDPLYF
jgi:hypothetical protein